MHIHKRICAWWVFKIIQKKTCMTITCIKSSAPPVWVVLLTYWISSQKSRWRNQKTTLCFTKNGVAKKRTRLSIPIPNLIHWILAKDPDQSRCCHFVFLWDCQWSFSHTNPTLLSDSQRLRASFQQCRSDWRLWFGHPLSAHHNGLLDSPVSVYLKYKSIRDI